MNPVYDLLRSDGSIVINKNLITAIGLNESIMFCELLSRYHYFADREQLQEDGSFFNTIFDLSLATGLADKAQRTAITKLTKLGLIAVTRRGIPAKRYFRINEDVGLIGRYLQEGADKRKDLIEKHRENPVNITVLPKAETCYPQGKELVIAEGVCNNTNYNNTNGNNTKSYKGILSVDENSISISFTDYCKCFSVDEEIKQSIEYYLDSYRKYREKEHPRLKEEQWGRVVLDWFRCYSKEFGIDYDIENAEDMELMIDKHFRTKYRNCDYNILHFISDGVKIRRMYEEAY